MRGKVSLPVLVLSDNRITPAHAGKSVLKTRDVNVKKDHPRTCEEKYGGTIYATKKIGITPAHAGKSPPEGGKGGL